MKQIDNKKAVIILICLIGIIVRSFYILKPIKKEQYDCKIWKLETIEDYDKIYEMDEEVIGSAGHLYYIMMLYNNEGLPDSAVGQYYHPPMHHLISAGWLRVMDLLPLNSMQKIESLEVLSLLYSVISIFFVYKILKKLNINWLGQALILAFVNFFPAFIYLSGFINNDPLITLLIIMCFYYLIIWKDMPSIKNTLIISLVFGIGMMTKTSMIVMLAPVGIVVLTEFIKLIKNKDKQNIRKMLIEMLIFILIVGTLGSWFQIRKKVLFGSEALSIQKPYVFFEVEKASIWDRFGITNKEILQNEIKVEDQNIFAYVLNSALFGLYSVTSDSVSALKFVIANMLKYMSILFTLTTIIGTIITIKKEIFNKKENYNMIIAIIAYLAWIAGFIYFNITMPYSCTMHSRYIGMLLILGMVLYGKQISESENKVWKACNVSLIIVELFVSVLFFVV